MVTTRRTAGGHTYSVGRLRLVLGLLTLATLPFVLGASLFIYYYIHYSVVVERRLKGEEWLVPSRLYARPQVLRPGLSLDANAVVKLLNGLRYEQRGTDVKAP